MKKKRHLIALALISLALLSSCGGKKSSKGNCGGNVCHGAEIVLVIDK